MKPKARVVKLVINKDRKPEPLPFDIKPIIDAIVEKARFDPETDPDIKRFRRKLEEVRTGA
ncbi:hypothetical protein SY88_10140 [Clostridiales bacterium PH28_bin88]|nr:hypothetical protein SY88_10140 [Clostridiales bacterium PH28_bin88]